MKKRMHILPIHLSLLIRVRSERMLGILFRNILTIGVVADIVIIHILLFNSN